MIKSITTLLTSVILVLGLALPSHAQNEAEKQKATATGQQITLKIEGMACSYCEQSAKNALEKLEGVKVDEVSASKGIARLTYTGSEPISDKTFKGTVENAGYKLKKVQRKENQDTEEGGGR
ncbi:MAG: heavy-metal-associated domain-containing protein [Balneolaceae bacterium]